VPEEEINEMGAYLTSPARQERAAAKTLSSALSGTVPSFGVIQTRDAFQRAAWAARNQREYGVVTLSAQLAEINDLLGAITLIAGAVMVLFLSITVVGVSNTFTMVVWERTREIGTLRAIGMQRARAVTLFLLEALLLGLSGVIVGGALGIAILLGVASFVVFPPNAVTTLFLTGGRLAWELPMWGVMMMGLLAVLASLFGALRASVRAGRLDPVEALRHQN
jgi:ABC-type lipoprotein release transport system permease subunit